MAAGATHFKLSLCPCFRPSTSLSFSSKPFSVVSPYPGSSYRPRYPRIFAFGSNDIKVGANIEVDGSPWKVIEFLHVKPGKGAAYVRTTLKNYVTGNTMEKTFRAGSKIEEADIFKETKQFTYKDGSQFVFMDLNSYEETRLNEADVGDKTKWYKEFTLLLGEWWDGDILAIMRQALLSGNAPNVSDAYTINGQPGDLYRCSILDTAKFYVDSGDTVLLRVINAALNQQLYFAVANHMLTVVGADAAYHKPFTTPVIMVGPGQTTNVLLTADQPPGKYYMAAQAYATSQAAPFDNTTTTAILEYISVPCGIKTGLLLQPILPQFPAYNDSATVFAFTSQFRSLYPSSGNNVDHNNNNNKVPTIVDEDLFFTVGLGIFNCIPGPTCQGPNGTRFASSMNNVSFVLPNSALLQAYYQSIPGVYTTDFPGDPPLQFDFTGNVPPALWQPISGTKLYKLKFGSAVQLVLQDTAIMSTEDHPIHLHGYQFYIVGQGFGNYNPTTDPENFNLIDPPERNTIDVPVGGWVVIRFVADNPGVWLMHCHIDTHLTWGLAMAFLVENGAELLQSVRAPPLDLPPC